jgi:hypothetical protein
MEDLPQIVEALTCLFKFDSPLATLAVFEFNLVHKDFLSLTSIIPNGFFDFCELGLFSPSFEKASSKTLVNPISKYFKKKLGRVFTVFLILPLSNQIRAYKANIFLNFLGRGFSNVRGIYQFVF